MPLTVDVQQSYDFAQISWAIVALVAILVVGLLVWFGRVRNIEGEVNGNRINIGTASPGNGKRPPNKQEQALLAITGLTDMKHQTANDVRARQKRIIDDYYERFMETLHSADYFPAEVMWRHFCDPLINTADENHILTRLDDSGGLNRSYVEEKMMFVQGRYSRIIAKDKKSLPPWTTVETDMQILMVCALNDFVEEARHGWGMFHDSVERVRKIAPKWSFLLDQIMEGVKSA